MRGLTGLAPRPEFVTSEGVLGHWYFGRIWRLRDKEGLPGVRYGMPKLIPRDTDFVDTAPIRITTVVTAKATPEEVWAVMADNERWPEWFEGMKSCRTTSAASGGVGSTRFVHVDLFKVNERFVAWDPPHRWAFTILDVNLPGVVSVVEHALIEPAGTGETRITYVMASEVASYLRPLVPILRWRLTGMLRKGLAGLEGQVVRLRSEIRATGATASVLHSVH